MVRTVVVDAGHGGQDPGAGAFDLREKDVCLDVATRLVAELNRRPGFRASLTRDDDTFIPLRGRSAVAEKRDWPLIRRTDGKVAKTLKAHELWQRLAMAAWASSSRPGVSGEACASSASPSSSALVRGPSGPWRPRWSARAAATRAATSADPSAGGGRVRSAALTAGTSICKSMRSSSGPETFA